MEESISLEETNKIRISLGLKPLTEDGPAADDKDKQAEANYARRREQEAKERETKLIQDRIAKVRNRRELHASLKGTTLGDVDGDVDDTLKWIRRSKKREKELAKKRQEEFESMDKQFQGEEYTERDLVGLKVSHDFEELDEGEARILTLKDSRILDNEEDELQNIEMAEAERTKKNNKLKIKKRDYTGYDDEEFAPGAAGMNRAVLSKYDEDLGVANETGFRLGASNLQTKAEKVAKQEQEAAAAVNKSLLSIDYSKNLKAMDYLQEGDIGFKKPKTKKKRSTRRTADAELAPDDEMSIDEKPVIPRPRNLDTNFVDDDELQAALARSRRAKLHKAKKLAPEELAKNIIREDTQPATVKVEADADATDGLTFDDTSEFVRSVGMEPLPVKREPIETSMNANAATLQQISQSRDASMGVGDEALEELEAGEVVVKEEEEDEDMEMLSAIEGALKAADVEQLAAQENALNIAVGGTSAEQTFNAGMASTLNILRQQGILAEPNADQKEREKVQLQRDLWLAEQRRNVARRELERQQARGGNKDQATREYENRLREQQEARDNLEGFKNYKPDVKIVYYDEYGRELTMKEAWKALSHKFHGKGSGNKKTEKRLKKIAEERKREAMASGDTPLSMSKAFQIRQEKTGQAHFVLSVGNRGAVPQAAEFLDPQPLAKGKTEKKNKKKNEAKAAQAQNGGFMTVPAPQTSMLGNGESPGPSSGIQTTSNGSPAPRPGFSRISSSAVVEPSSQGGTPVPSDRTKVAFGFGMKRKAGEESQDSPPPKRR